MLCSRHHKGMGMPRAPLMRESVSSEGDKGDFPGGAVVKNAPANAGDMGLSPGLEDPTYRGATKPVHHNY